ncbi:hypothetical protein RRG08_005072 [Elysia crispata]|uniref:Uncharacterized protein n=1 Tax=Elysia crispata TaxID=231223 RepID=A0AAE0XZ37_9GAST|nr:hypothetical protein RRG08_005072 [Elysia crispata]
MIKTRHHSLVVLQKFIVSDDHRRNHENVSEILPTGLQTQDKSSKNPVRHTPVSRARLLLQHFLKVLRIGLRTVNSNTRKKKLLYN